MGIVDKAKSWRTFAEGRFLPQRFVFHHVPKCGGTSVGRALRKRYILSQATVTPEESFRAFEAFSERSDREKMLVDVLDLREQMLLYHMFHDVRGISLHVRFSQPAWNIFSDKYKFITILRDPVSRFISHYNWSHAKPNAHARIDESFEEFLKTERAKRMGATFVEYYSGLPKDFDMTSDEAVHCATESLRKFSVVGNISNIKKFEADVRRELGVSIKVRHENKGGKDRRFVSPDNLSNEVLKRVHSICSPDIAVWESVKDRFEE